jgi:NAD(P)-dependent dehydrogenase (short-subunit alcohol dehydrogenase family)
MIAINLTGVSNGINAAVGARRAAAPSSIITVSSTTGLQGHPALLGYSAAKFGIRGLTKCVALDLGADNVRCNSVHPGNIATPMTADLDTPQKHVALRRVGTSAELSNLIVFSRAMSRASPPEWSSSPTAARRPVSPPGRHALTLGCGSLGAGDGPQPPRTLSVCQAGVSWAVRMV